MNTTGYAVFAHVLAGGWAPILRDETNRPVIFPIELEAQREIADNLMTRLQEFLDGERDFEDATTVDEFVVHVRLFPDGSIEEEHGGRFP